MRDPNYIHQPIECPLYNVSFNLRNVSLTLYLSFYHNDLLIKPFTDKDDAFVIN